MGVAAQILVSRLLGTEEPVNSSEVLLYHQIATKVHPG